MTWRRVTASVITNFKIFNMCTCTSKKDNNYFLKIGCQGDEMRKWKRRPLKVNVPPYLGALRPEFPSCKDTLHQLWLKLACWFRRGFFFQYKLI
jgi:hypothetical protein